MVGVVIENLPSKTSFLLHFNVRLPVKDLKPKAVSDSAIRDTRKQHFKQLINPAGYVCLRQKIWALNLGCPVSPGISNGLIKFLIER